MLKELFDEDVSDEQVDEVVEAFATNTYEARGVRLLMIRLQQLEADRVQNEATQRAVLDAYHARGESISRQEARLREELENAVRVLGKMPFPDVGTAYMQNSKPKIEVVDKALAEQWAIENGFSKTKPTADLTAAKEAALKAVIELGELPPEETGMAFLAERQELRIRKAG